MTPDIAAAVAASRAAQGFPDKVSDLAALRRVTALLGSRRDTGALADPGVKVLLANATSPQGGRHG